MPRAPQPDDGGEILEEFFSDGNTGATKETYKVSR